MEFGDFLITCTTTTKFLDNKICTFKILLSWRFPRKTAFWTILLSDPLSLPPSKSQIFIFIVVSPSLIFGGVNLDVPIARIDSQIRANRLILANRFRVAELNPFLRIALRRGKKLRIAGLRRFARKSLARYENRVFFFCESIYKTQIKHIKNFSIKDFGPPMTPPPEILYVWAFSCILKGKEAPNIKNLRGPGSLERGGGLGGGCPAKFFMCLCLFSGPEFRAIRIANRRAI